jgi:SSS family solute:Na+ symporter
MATLGADSECSDRTFFLVFFGFYIAWMMGISVLAYNKLKGSDDYATHFVGRKDYGVLVMGLTMYASAISGNSVANNPNTASGLGYMCFWIINVYTIVNMGFACMYPRMRRLSVERKWNSWSDILSDRFASRAVFYLAIPFPICGLVCYVIAQLWAFHELMPVVSAGYISANPITQIVTVVIYICESMGGFDAVSFTDVVQGIIIIIALLVGPIWMAEHFGPLDGTVEWGCKATWKQVVPDGNGTKEQLRGCYAYESEWNVLHPAAKTYSYYNKPKWPSYGVDGSYWFNNTCWIATANYLLFFAFGIFPHVVQRVFASKTDETCKRSMMLMAICMCLAGMPGLILGFFYAIHLKKDYSAATAAFGAILDYMMRQGLFAEMMGVAAACGGCAAIMSTIDSTTLAATNILTKEVVVNDLSRIWPQLVEPRIMTIIERLCSGTILGIGMFQTTYMIPIIVEGDPLEATLMMNRLAFYQFGFLVQAFPVVMCALFPEKIWMSPMPAALGLLTSLIVLPIITVTLWEVKGYGTPKPEILEGTPNLYLHPSNVALIFCCAVTFGLHAVLPKSIKEADFGPGWMRAFLNDKTRQEFHPTELMKMVEGNIEPARDKIGVASMVLLYIQDIATLPWYGISYSGCDFETYKQYNQWNADPDGDVAQPPDCDPEPSWGSMPRYGAILFMFTIFSFALNVVCFSRWIPKPGALEPEQMMNVEIENQGVKKAEEA